jgi:hypothetical protein
LVSYPLKEWGFDVQISVIVQGRSFKVCIGNSESFQVPFDDVSGGLFLNLGIDHYLATPLWFGSPEAHIRTSLSGMKNLEARESLYHSKNQSRAVSDLTMVTNPDLPPAYNLRKS